MTGITTLDNRVTLGDPVPRFSAPLITGGSFDLHVSAGRWVVLSFLGSPQNPRVSAELTELLGEASLFAEDSLVVGCVFTEKPADADQILAVYDAVRNPPAAATETPETVPTLARVEWEHIQRIISDCDGNISQAARLLGIHRRSLQRKLGKYPPRR